MHTSPRRPAAAPRLLALLAALAALVLLAACEPGREPSPGPIESATPLVGRERRAAAAAAEPTDELSVAVPAHASRAVVHVAAVKDSPWSLGGEAVARVRLPGGVLLEQAVPLSAPGSGEWSALEAVLPVLSTEGPLQLDLWLDTRGRERVDRAWWSVQFEGLAPEGSRNILLISLDTVRRDAVSAYGQPLPTTPHLDELAARGTLFTQAISAAPWTLPSHVSVMTGVLPSWHQRVDPLRLDHELPALPTLATLLAARGYDTAAVTGSGSISWSLGATRGFSSIIEHEPTRDPRWWRPFEPECNAGARDAIAFLERRKTRRAPFFLFWHTYEPHFPYHDERFRGTRVPLPPGVAEDAREDWQRYLGDIARADAALGAVLDTLEREHLAATTDIIVMSDHGEDFGEHSAGRREEATRHGNGLFETQLRVPLIVVSPSVAPGTRDEQVSLLDVFPTVLACAGLDAPAGTTGHALQAPGGSGLVVSEALYPRYVEAESKSVREGTGLKYVATLGQPARESLFDVLADPLESSSLAPSRPADVERLREGLLLSLDGAPPLPAPASGAELPPAVLESLRSLGYVE